MNLEAKFARGNPKLLLFIIALMWLSFFLIRWYAPPDLLDKDQERPASYMADAALNGHWIVQVDDGGHVTSKPPMYTWIGAALVLLTGELNDVALYLPAGLSVLGCCFLAFYFGRRFLGVHTAFIGATVLLVSTLGLRIMYLARTDALFSLATFLAACLGFMAWKRGRGWIPFWSVSAFAALTKGPLGLVLGLGGLVGLFFKDRAAFQMGKNWPRHVIGILLYVLITMGWLYLAYLQLGDAVIAKIIGREHIEHMNWASQRFHVDYLFFTKPTLFFIGRFFPWSLLTLQGIWKVWKKPAHDPNERQFEIFLTSYLIFGVAFFSIFPHQRADHLFPLMPAAGLLAGRELYQWLQKITRVRYSLKMVAGFWVISLALFTVYSFKIDPAGNPWIAKTAGVKQVAEKFSRIYGPQEEIYFVNVPYGFQFYLNTMKVRTPAPVAAQKLAQDREVFVVVKDIQDIQDHLPEGVPVYTVMRWPETGRGLVHIVSNRVPKEEGPHGPS